jgi:hypothetical protein
MKATRSVVEATDWGAHAARALTPVRLGLSAARRNELKDLN